MLALLVVVVGLAQYANADWYSGSCPGGYELTSGQTIYNNIAGGNAAVTCAWINANWNKIYANPCSIPAGTCLYPPSSGTSTTCPSSCSSACCPSTAGSTYGSYYGNGYTGYNYYGGATASYGCGSGKYSVQYGNTFWGLGGSTTAGMCAWMNANPGVDPCALSPGQCINQPTSSTSTQCYNQYSGYYTSSYSCRMPFPTGTWGSYTGPYYGSGAVGTTTYCSCNPGEYCIQPGDTFCKLAGYNTATACAWVQANTWGIANNLQVGQCVKSPYTTYAYQTATANCGFTC